jgi:hypothetical protein
MSCGAGATGSESPSAATRPTSKKKFSKPEGVTRTGIRAGIDPVLSKVTVNAEVRNASTLTATKASIR